LEQFGEAESVRIACAQLRAQCSEAWVASLPVIPQHGDFFVNNLVIQHGQFRFLDWESYGMVDLPFYDLFTFLVSLLGWGAARDGWSADLASQMPALIDRYASGLGEERPDVSTFLPLTLANSFYLHWVDGRREFTARMYQMIRDYLEHPAHWEGLFGRK
jgi:hypothetical protein